MMVERQTERRKLQPAGPLDWPESDRSQWIAWLRFQFILAALKLEPEMEVGLHELLRVRISNLQPERYRAALDKWSSRYNLRDRWCRKWVIQTLGMSHLMAGQHPDVEPQIGITYHFDGPPPVEPLQLPDLAWNPFESPREVMENRYRQYLDKVDEAFRQGGYRPTPTRREPRHFYWLAGLLASRVSGLRLVSKPDSRSRDPKVNPVRRASSNPWSS
jgi:hypothetical protein